MALPLLPIALGLAQYAPSLMRFFGAGEKSAAVVERVVQVAQQVTGTATPQEALEAVRANAQFQRDFALRALDLDAQLEQAYLADRGNARARDIEYVRAGRHNTRADLMVLFDVIGLIACLVVIGVLRTELSGEAVTLIATLASYFGLSLRDAHQFEFGSSRSSRDKDQILASQVQTKG